MVKNEKTGGYSFKSEIVPKDKVNDFFAKIVLKYFLLKLLSIFERSFFCFIIIVLWEYLISSKVYSRRKMIIRMILYLKKN